MLCPRCGRKVSTTDTVTNGQFVARRKICVNGHVFKTIEIPLDESVAKDIFYCAKKKGVLNK